ncbi:hypothetical protein SEA_WHYTU_22 [Arthrobacter phage Whytu]|uniref:Uncharacterized protein n=1 Tax=Arthrobacter phage Whytu TaxID=2713260 RepID=A0A6G8R2U2_9CAUD|nr:hypothetical protein QEX69_gp22 [Arthrobacter phage Whytu]QIN94491.1 hypothetical protein SEA_WHYTU_22 [Arthrobacter phage Whytu]
MTVPVATGVAVLIIILAAVGAGAAVWWLGRLIQWLWERRPHGRLGRHDWCEIRQWDGRMIGRLCWFCPAVEWDVPISSGKVDVVD